MNHVASIGLDVHARSVSAAAFNLHAGEIVSRKFKYDPAEIAEWALRFDSPKAVYESGVTGFHLCKALKALGVDRAVAAVSRLQKPAANKRVKNDRADAETLARLLATHNIAEVFVPDDETEALQALTRAPEDAREDLTRAKQRLAKFLLRLGHLFDEATGRGQRIGNWTRAHWARIRGIELKEPAAQEALDCHISEVRHFEGRKKALEKMVLHRASAERWRGRTAALCCLKGIDTMTASALVAEAGVFSRSGSAGAFASWPGLAPSEHSSGESERKGGITRAGNKHARKLLAGASWHCMNCQPSRKVHKWSGEVPLKIENHAHRGVCRLVERRRRFHASKKKPAVANVATARELAGWAWAVGRMCEGTLD